MKASATDALQNRHFVNSCLTVSVDFKVKRAACPHLGWRLAEKKGHRKTEALEV
ncbi:hypothetical protein CES85_5243 [Ochrobactrum quorumnocens]|uniref:Uncharacterized protein n=1 Tax=Ochrobactrum quorumnocens TaxID=271865 RepID=A0A248UDQ9_9HYPH|nr:hypothetical protein CES85_5243 [[Ochrobactrum] quorumnocens]